MSVRSAIGGKRVLETVWDTGNYIGKRNKNKQSWLLGK